VISVYLVDDHPILRQGLIGMLSLEEDITIVGQAADGEAAVPGALHLRPDVVIMDLRLPRQPGPVVIERMLAAGSAVDPPWTPRILVLTTYGDDSSITSAIGAGASGYLLKSATADEIATAIRATSDGRSVLSPSVADSLVRQVRLGSGAPSLTLREREVLSRVAAGLTNSEIATALYVEPSTVKTHIEHIFAKLGVARRSQAIARAHELHLA